MKMAAILAREQNESWDGTGHPNRLMGEQIHLFSRIVALADYYNTLISTQQEGQVITQQHILDSLKAAKGKQLDPELVDCLVNDLNDFEQILTQNPDAKT